MTLVDDVADLLAVHDEVDAVCGQSQKGVMDMMQLQKTETHFSSLARKHFNKT